MISERLSHRVFGGPAAAVGKPLALSSRSYTVLGVAGQAFQFLRATTDVWMPAELVRAANPRCCGFRLVGRLQRGTTVNRAAAEVAALAGAPTSGALTGGNVRATVVGIRDQTGDASEPDCGAALRLERFPSNCTL